MPRFLLLLILLGAARPCFAQLPGDAATVKQLYDQQRWEDVVRLTSEAPDQPADLDYYRGMALAKLSRYDPARRALEAGAMKDPADKRFPLELAGIAFRQERPDEAKKYLRQALKLDPRDPYAINFLATLYFLDDNLEAALKYWNRIGKPRVEEIQTDPPLRLKAAVLDRNFACAPASQLRLEDYRLTRARLESLGIFSDSRLELVPRSEPGADDYDLKLQAEERNGWGSSLLGGLFSLLRGIPYQTVYPEFYNLRHSAINFRSLVRSDSRKRRAWAALSGPLGERPGWRYRIYADARDEDWNLTGTFRAAPTLLPDLKLKRYEAGAAIESIVSSRLRWTGGLAVSRRTFPNFPTGASTFNSEFTSSYALEARGRIESDWLRLPERRLTLISYVSGDLGKAYASPFGRFARVQASTAAHWFPRARGDDFEMSEQVRAGKILGRVPMDELFILGLERDNDLPLGGHIGTRDGKKGSAPLGRGYALSNWEINKNLIDTGLFRVRLAPFLDTGRPYDKTGDFGSGHWLWDTGARAKFSLLQRITFVFTYGKDLRTGRNSYYVGAAHRF